MTLPYFQIDAFANRPFTGNPAGVCPLEKWLPDDVLQNIAMENNLSETAFVVPNKHGWDLRWFTPTVEVDLCGHATLAAAYVLAHVLREARDILHFQTRSGLLSVQCEGDLLILNFPCRPGVACDAPEALLSGLGKAPQAVLKSRDYMAVFASEEDVRSLQPNMDALAKLDCVGIIATAPGVQADFVSRFFAPAVGVPEDPVTGSAHCTLIPYWANRLAKQKLRALQLSKRGGGLFCENAGDRVKIGGKAALYSQGFIQLSFV